MRIRRATSPDTASSIQWLTAVLAARASMLAAGRYISRPSVIISVGPSPAAANTLSRPDASFTSAARRSRRHFAPIPCHHTVLVVQHRRKIDFDPAQRRWQFQPPGARIQSGSHTEHGAIPSPATVSSTSWSRYRLRMAIPKHMISIRSIARRIAMPRSPASRAAKGSRISPSARSVSNARQAAVISAVSLTWEISWASGGMVSILP